MQKVNFLGIVFVDAIYIPLHNRAEEGQNPMKFETELANFSLLNFVGDPV